MNPNAMVLAQNNNTSSYATLSTMLDKNKDALARVIPRHMTPDRLMRIALSAVSRSQKLTKCSPESLLRSIMDAAKLGLEPTGAIGGAYLVPYWNGKIGKYEAQLQTDYRGELALARRSGEISTVSVHVVYQHDIFALRYGDDERLEHTPKREKKDRGEPIGVYAIAKLKDGGIQREFLTKDEVYEYRAKSKSAEDGPWKTDELAMWRKTAIRRLCNLLPRSIEYIEHIENEEARDYGRYEPSVELVVDDEDLGTRQPAAPPLSSAAKLTRRIREQKEEAPERMKEPEGGDEKAAPAAPNGPTTGQAEPPSSASDATVLTPDEFARGKAALSAVQAELVHLVGRDAAKVAWDSVNGVKTLRGVRARAHLDERMAQATALVELAKVGAEISAAKKTILEKVPEGEKILRARSPDSVKNVFTLEPTRASGVLDELLAILQEHGYVGEGELPWELPAPSNDREPGADG